VPEVIAAPPRPVAPVIVPAQDDAVLMSLLDRTDDVPAFMPTSTLDRQDPVDPALLQAVSLPPELQAPVGELPTPNRVEEIVCLAQGIVSLPADGLPLKQQLVTIERSLIEQALQRTNGNVSQTARLLHLQRTTLIEKIQKYELRVGETRTG